MEFWKTKPKNTLNFNLFHVIDINKAEQSADFKTISDDTYRNFPVECKGHLDKNENRPLYQEAEKQVTTTMTKYKPPFNQGFITILFGDQNTGKLRIYIEILNQ
jgi:hypothetical protein